MRDTSYRLRRTLKSHPTSYLHDPFNFSNLNRFRVYKAPCHKGLSDLFILSTPVVSVFEAKLFTLIKPSFLVQRGHFSDSMNLLSVRGPNLVTIQLHQLDDDFLVNLLPRPSQSIDTDSFNNSFYTPNIDFQKLNLLTSNTELLNLSKNFEVQNMIINNLRWSYRYNILHRRTMYNSHKITQSKKLISGGYFDLNLTGSNAWFSAQYGRDLAFGKKKGQLSSIDLIKNNWNLLYRSNLGYNFKINNSYRLMGFPNPQDNFLRLSFYESSFHFFLNRSKTYSSLNSNEITSTPNSTTFNPTDVNTQSNLMSLYQTTFSSSLKNLLRLDCLQASL